MRTEPGTARGSTRLPEIVRKQRRPPDNRDEVDRTRDNGEVDGAYLRAVAGQAASRDFSQECFDLTVAGELRALGEELDAKARQLDGHAESRVTLGRRLSEALTTVLDRTARILPLGLGVELDAGRHPLEPRQANRGRLADQVKDRRRGFEGHRGWDRQGHGI